MIDSHSHIYMSAFDEDRDAVVVRAAEAGLTQLLQVGCTLPESERVVALATAVPGIYASVGVHPHDAATLNPEVLDGLERLTHHPKVLAWGEIGLDYYYDHSPRDVQRAAFAAQLERAAQRNLPVVIHTREAEPDTVEILTRHPVTRGGHVHCFTGTAELAMQLLDMGFHIGFTGIITFKASEALREVVRQVPLSRILIETDSPYLAPIPKRGRRNEPAYVSYVAEAVAGIKGVTMDEVVAHTTANFRTVYGHGITNWETLALPVAG